MTDEETIIQKLDYIEEMLIDTLSLIVSKNANGNQFDYVNSPKLSDSFDALYRTVRKIEQIIYQET